MTCDVHVRIDPFVSPLSSTRLNNMLSTARLHAPHASKEYAERGVQTDAIASKTSPAPPSSHSMDTPEELQDQATRPQEPASSPLSNRSREPTDGSSAYIHDQPDFSFDSGTSADKSMTTTTRTYEMEQISLNRPTALVSKQPTSRVVSLPEATPKFRMKQILERKTVRIVSMPLTTSKRFDTSSDSLDVSGDIFVSEDEERPRVRVRSQATDVPHTPSAPSSPDSIVIIANNSNQLSTDFLRQQTIEESPPDSDEGTAEAASIVF